MDRRKDRRTDKPKAICPFIFSKVGDIKIALTNCLLSYICRLSPFLGFKILNFNILGVFREMNIFWGFEDFVDIFFVGRGGGYCKTGLLSGAEPEFLEREFMCIKMWGFALLILSHFS